MSEDRRSGTGAGQAPPRDAGRRLEEPAPAADREPATDALPIGRGSTAVDQQVDPQAEAGAAPGPSPAGSSAVGSSPVGAGAGRPAATPPASPARPRYDPRPPAAAVRPAPRRRARLAITRVDPWSVFTLSLLISIFLGVVLVVAVFVLYSLLTSLGVFDSVNGFAQDLQIIDAGTSVVSRGQVLGVSAVLAAVDVVLLTVLATLGAFLYNLCASVTGGIEVALAERE